MASELSLLIPAFRKLLTDAITATQARGFQIEPMLTLVPPSEQAAMWKQGRTATEAELKSLALDNAGAHFLADCIRFARPKETNRVTDDLPGTSWYQWGEAASVVWVDGSHKLNYSPTFKERPLQLNGYVVWMEEATKIGLFTPHHCQVQYRPHASPLELCDIQEIDAEMRRRFGR